MTSALHSPPCKELIAEQKDQSIFYTSFPTLPLLALKALLIFAQAKAYFWKQHPSYSWPFVTKIFLTELDENRKLALLCLLTLLFFEAGSIVKVFL